MGSIVKAATWWKCDFGDCGFEWLARAAKPPQQCPQCWRRAWNRGPQPVFARFARKISREELTSRPDTKVGIHF